MKVRSVRAIAPVVGLVLVAVTAAPALASPTATPRAAGPAAAAAGGLWLNTRLDPGERAAQLVGQMTLDEKIAQVHGVGYPLIADPTAGYAGKIPGNARLGIPAVYLADSPVGVGNGSTGVTQWADTAALASTWDTDVAGQYGQAYGAEQAGKGHNVALGREQVLFGT